MVKDKRYLIYAGRHGQVECKYIYVKRSTGVRSTAKRIGMININIFT